MAEHTEKAAPRARVVLVDDDDMFRESLSEHLADAGFAVTPFGSGSSALQHILEAKGEQIILLDWKMPEISGIEVLRRLRSAGVDSPVIFLTSLTDQIYEEVALHGGALDFVEKTRSFSILLKRMNLIAAGLRSARRQGEGEPGGEKPPSLRLGALELRSSTRRALWKGHEVPLTITEFRIVELLATRAGRPLTYRDLYDFVRGKGFVAGSGGEGHRANVRAFIKRIREKFYQVDPAFGEIEVISGVGYRWREDVAVTAASADAAAHRPEQR
ncbi:MAG TPA: response regulator transcription factor [Alphaproteobacteria bacterium]|nr:response regulator transcription factor [Alphaproteobacteria bacterium]